MAKRKVIRRKKVTTFRNGTTKTVTMSDAQKVRDYAAKFPARFAKVSSQWIADRLNVSLSTVYNVKSSLTKASDVKRFAKDLKEEPICPTDFGPFEKVEQSEDQLLENVVGAMAPVEKQAQQIIVRLSSTDPIDVIIENLSGNPVCVLSIDDVGQVMMRGLTARS